MRRLVEGIDPRQATLFPECLEDWIDEDNPIRVVSRHRPVTRAPVSTQCWRGFLLVGDRLLLRIAPEKIAIGQANYSLQSSDRSGK